MYEWYECARFQVPKNGTLGDQIQKKVHFFTPTFPKNGGIDISLGHFGVLSGDFKANIEICKI